MNENTEHEGTTDIPLTENDTILYTLAGGNIRWDFDTRTRKFQLLSLPTWLKDAPDDVKCDLTEWCREKASGKDIPLPESVQTYRDAPSTRARRAGTPTLEAWT